MQISSRLRRAAVTAGVALAALGTGTYALAATSAHHSVTGVTYNGCVKTSGSPIRVLFDVHAGAAVTCPKGSFAISWNQMGPQGPAGPQGPQGPQGPAGTPAEVSVTATTNISGRDDSGNGGNWAVDTFTRSMTVTRRHAAPSTDCGNPATQCWFYTATLSDTGTFATDSGAQTPNQACTEPNGGPSCAGLTVSGTVDGSLTGGGQVEFYADTGSPSAAGVPADVTGGGPVSTTNWYKLFFPGGTNFGLTGNGNAPWTAWSWTYSAPNTCEQWADAYNNGDGNGTYAADGNIAGINGC